MDCFLCGSFGIWILLFGFPGVGVLMVCVFYDGLLVFGFLLFRFLNWMILCAGLFGVFCLLVGRV